MQLVIAIMGATDEDTEAIDTGLEGKLVLNGVKVRQEFVVPFESRANAIDCLRVVLRDLERETG